ncbi:DUF6708 domain-containing protein [Achromobacter kerstersii]|jgi:hypothetical protein|uniref:DUF6708 domain-containing protein n=1 Tax=Achromobacter kerstersii TaxID=1353890 RepID=UPI0012E20541|nr:DUF6708 domain-containing protein [Achromobacter kerstersii]
MVNALIHDHAPTVERLPRTLLIGAKTLARARPASRSISGGPTPIDESLGVRQISDQCIELESYGNQIRNTYASGIGVSMVMALIVSMMLTAIAVFLTPERPPGTTGWFLIAVLPWFGVIITGAIYLCNRTVFGRFRGGFIRIHRGTRKLYFVTPRHERLLTLDWDALQALAGYIPIISAAGYTSRYPLYLIATDWTQSPPKEICVSCGNLGWRDDGDSARQLWDYLQTFMEHGQSNLPKPPPIPPRLSRKQTFLRFYRDWAEKFRRDLATPKGKRWAPLLIPAKILALICIVFPDSLAEFIEYNVPYTSFPKEIDELCGFADPLAPVTRACT